MRYSKFSAPSGSLESQCSLWVLVDTSVEPLLTGLHQRPRRLRDGVPRQSLSGEQRPTADQVAARPVRTLIIDRELAPAYLHDRCEFRDEWWGCHAGSGQVVAPYKLTVDPTQRTVQR